MRNMLFILCTAVILGPIYSKLISLNKYQACYRVHGVGMEYVAFTTSSKLTVFPQIMKLHSLTVKEASDTSPEEYLSRRTLYLTLTKRKCTSTLQLSYETTTTGKIRHDIKLYFGPSQYDFYAYKIWQQHTVFRSIHEIGDVHGLIGIMVEFASGDEITQPPLQKSKRNGIPKLKNVFDEKGAVRHCLYCMYRNRVFGLNFGFSNPSRFEYSPMVDIKVTLHKKVSDLKGPNYLFELRLNGMYMNCSDSIFNRIQQPNVLYDNSWRNFYMTWTINDKSFKRTLRSVYYVSGDRLELRSSYGGMVMDPIKIKPFSDRGDISPSGDSTLNLLNHHAYKIYCNSSETEGSSKIDKQNSLVLLENYEVDNVVVDSFVSVERSYGNERALVYDDTPDVKEVGMCKRHLEVANPNN